MTCGWKCGSKGSKWRPIDILWETNYRSHRYPMEAVIAREPLDLLRGTLDMLILRALLLQSTHGFGVARWIEQATDDALQIEEGSLYPALYRLEKRGLIESEWGFSDNNRKARFYKLTRSGRTHLRVETVQFKRFANVVFKALAVDAQTA